MIMGPLCLLASFGSFCIPFLSSPEKNLIRIFIFGIFDYDFEKYAFRYFFRVVSGIIVLLFTLISLSPIIGYASMGIMYIHMIVTWPPFFLKTAKSTSKIMTVYPMYCALRVFNAIGQEACRLVTPTILGFAFVVSLITNVIVLTMFNRTSALLYILCVMVSVSFTAFTTGEMQIASMASKGSIKYIEYFKMQAALTTNLVHQKIGRALRGCMFAVGSFYNVNDEIVLVYSNHVVHSTIDLLLITA